MNNKAKNKTVFLIHRIYGVLLSISVLIAGICLIAGCISIYNMGDKPFSREAVAAVFGDFDIPIYLCIAMTLLGLVLDIVLPQKENQILFKVPYMIRDRVLSKKTLEGAEPSVLEPIKKQQRLRLILCVVRTVLVILTLVIALVYWLNPASFDDSDINGSMIKAMLFMLPCLAVSFAFSVVSSYLIDRSLVKESELIRSLPSAKEPAVQNNSSEGKINLVRAIIFCIGAAILIYGFFAGGTADVLTKAVNICTECIGLG